ncbi:Na/Pi cotransporter family protein [Helicobacter saguini]|uniref:Na/Pi cotransporter family protein n=1 Tax=Helicobacter saguini TaxID=1548018 RepID=A0A347VNQ6_9HELI|nr:Na/Pi symporter [Helicobacter saguini]MWV61675.1 Na/Pi cotransporter family protein [Helicobacter saguini]MWV67652.1 Na/Pi cotransporter family protein [Helicobacter saguini]MWV70004.1 Na/Pi cotransporter family protein [Helicobacter saguini]MWV72782.1 Na/Pi cotransporter family protein [Helicobacter saguini]TLD92706.1 Na/Pi cotransporter family protein [Helicobacter saguini]
MYKIQRLIRQYSICVVIVFVIYGLSINEQLGKLCAGIAILLFGMLFLSDGFKSFSGGFLEKILTNYTKTPIRSIIFGTIVTSLMQSSSLVSVLSISFVSASLITLVQGIGVMFGANLGNTTGSWLIAGASSINISSLALPLIVGGLLFNFQSNNIYKGIGKILAGLGFFFLGVFYIKAGFESFQGVMDLSQYKLEGYKAIFGFLLIGALVTSIIQSSHATLAIIISAFMENQIGYTEALAATLGTSVGGVVTALVASLSANMQGRKLAIANCIFNFTTVLIVAIFFTYFMRLNDFIADALGFDSDSILRLAIFHTLFNLFGVILLTPFIPKIAALLNRIFKEKSSEETTPLFINDALLPYKETAIEALDNEVKHLYDNAFGIIAHTTGFSREDIRSNKPIKELLDKREWFKQDFSVNDLYNAQIKVLFNAIMDFSTKLQTFVSEDSYTQRIVSLQIASRKIAEATKNIAMLQNNMKKFELGDNAALKKEYDDMRYDLGNLLRMIESIKSQPRDTLQDSKAALKKQKKFFKDEDKQAFVVVEKLISQNAINAQEGTSLLNDLSFVHSVAKELIIAANHIYALVNIKSLGKDSPE